MQDPPPQKQDDLEPIVTVEGVVERIVFENTDTGFLVARLRQEGDLDLTTFVGDLMAISPGETIRLRGRWVDDKRFGRQLRVVSYETILPSSIDGIEKYLGSGLIAGIGPTYAKRLVEAFGVATLRVIDEEPKRLRTVEGIGPKRAKQIRESWASQKAIQSIMVFLQGHGITTSQAVKIYKAYGDGAVAVLRENPFRLADDIPGIAFRGADQIAARLGIAKDSPERVRAGLLHALGQATNEGHVFLPDAALREAASELLDVPEERVGAELVSLITEQKVIREGAHIFLPALHASERGVSDLLKKLIGTPHDPVPITNMENALKWAEKRFGIALSEEQRDAIRRTVDAKVMVITGGPGTGKTTVINSLLAILERKSVSFLLAAPTGRAAKRMEAATGRDARTIHRLLEYSPQKHGFARDENNPLVTDLIVVDEASMIDTQLMHSLLQALPAFARLVLVGDVDQLPAVGPGNVLFDIIASAAAPVVRLQTIFRQAAESGIITNAHRINAGTYPEFNDSDFFLIERDDPVRAVETVRELVVNRIPARFGYDPIREVQVLSPMRRGEAGVNRLNEVLQEALNPGGAPIPRRSLRHGDKVMQLRNNYELDVYNGDVGVITQVVEEMKEVEVTFDDDRKVLYGFDDLDDLGPAYAATVHKSQGSEYRAVVIPFLPQHYMMLQRNLLYTAITRGKELVIIVGNAKAVGMAVRNNRMAERNTSLVDRLRNAL